MMESDIQVPKSSGMEGSVVTVQPPPRQQHQERQAPPPYSPPAEPLPILQPPSHSSQHTSHIQAVSGGPVTVIPKLDRKPRPMTCPSCRHPIITTVIYESSTKTHIVAGFICGFTLWCCICCLAAIPYYMQCCKVAEHYCPSCNYYIGGYSKL